MSAGGISVMVLTRHVKTTVENKHKGKSLLESRKKDHTLILRFEKHVLNAFDILIIVERHTYYKTLIFYMFVYLCLVLIKVKITKIVKYIKIQCKI